MTKINKLHFNGVDYDIGDKDIHDLTAKSTLNSNDEFMIADSEDGNVHKKVKYADMGICSCSVSFLLVGGGGGGGNSTSTGAGGGGGGGGIYIEPYFNIRSGEKYDVKIGLGGEAAKAGGDSSFGTYFVYGGGAGATANNAGGCGANGGGGGSNSTCNISGGGGTLATHNNMYSGCCGGSACCYGGGGGGGAMHAGYTGTTITNRGRGGDGMPLCFTGEEVYYSTGGSGGQHCCCWDAPTASCTPGGGSGGQRCCPGCYATTYGSGGGGAGVKTINPGGHGCQGVLIICYPSCCNLSLSGANCCYECNGNCIHIFTQDGTLTVN